MPESILEVIAVDATDARAARDGGADRVELVADMSRQGLTPSIATFAAVRAAVDLPVRVMLRAEDGYALSDPGSLVAAAKALRAAGADEFVLGFLDAHAAIDLAAVEAVLGAIEGCRWTFHRALDHVADRPAARRALAGLPGLDYVLTAGGPATVEEGLATLTAEAALTSAAPTNTALTSAALTSAALTNAGLTSAALADAALADAALADAALTDAAVSAPRVLAGGGLRRHHLPPLLAAGVDAFHTGSAVRPDGRWDAPVDAGLVRAWRAALP